MPGIFSGFPPAFSAKLLLQFLFDNRSCFPTLSRELCALISISHLPVNGCASVSVSLCVCEFTCLTAQLTQSFSLGAGQESAAKTNFLKNDEPKNPNQVNREMCQQLAALPVQLPFPLFPKFVGYPTHSTSSCCSKVHLQQQQQQQQD